MSRLALPCIACGRELHNVDDMAGNQPYNGTAFTTHGHYGSTIYDPMDGHYLEINVCDACLALHPERALEGRDRRPVMEDGVIVRFEDVEWQEMPWMPDPESIDYALKVTRKESGIDDLNPLRQIPVPESDPPAAA
jgi:hypothetical protein